MTNTIQRAAASLSLGVFVAMIATTAVAQTTTPTTDRPKAVGTSQKTADEANRKAIETGKDAAFVRTGPTAADKASDAATTVKNKTGEAVDTVKDKTSDVVTTTKDKADKAVNKTQKAVTTDKDAAKR